MNGSRDERRKRTANGISISTTGIVIVATFKKWFNSWCLLQNSYSHQPIPKRSLIEVFYSLCQWHQNTESVIQSSGVVPILKVSQNSKTTKKTSNRP